MLYFSESSYRLEHFCEVYRNVNIKAKFHVPRLHSILEKYNPNLQKIQSCKTLLKNKFEI